MPLGGTDVRDDLAERPPAEPIGRGQLCHGQEPWLPGCHGNRGQRVPSRGDGWMRRGLGGEDLKSLRARRPWHSGPVRVSPQHECKWALGRLPRSIWDSGRGALNRAKSQRLGGGGTKRNPADLCDGKDLILALGFSFCLL